MAFFILKKVIIYLELLLNLPPYFIIQMLYMMLIQITKAMESELHSENKMSNHGKYFSQSLLQ